MPRIQSLDKSLRPSSRFVVDSTIRRKVFEHIKQNAGEKGIWLDSVNGYEDHAHCLVSLGREQSIAKIAKLIKGESAFWINNKQGWCNSEFLWQDDYWAVSISERHVPAVRNYIFRQEENHQRKSFAEEVDKFMKKYGWSYVKG